MTAYGGLPKGATISNKSGYIAIFVGGSTLAGYPTPAYLQVKSEAQAENIKVSIDLSKMQKCLRRFWIL